MYIHRSDGKAKMQEIAAEALGKIGDPRTVGDETGFNALKEIKDRRAVGPLIEALHHQNRRA